MSMNQGPRSVHGLPAPKPNGAVNGSIAPVARPRGPAHPPPLPAKPLVGGRPPLTGRPQQFQSSDDIEEDPLEADRRFKRRVIWATLAILLLILLLLLLLWLLLAGPGWGNGQGTGYGNGTGSGSGDGTGSGSGSGDGAGQGDGSGDDTGSGKGAGQGDQTGDGKASGKATTKSSQGRQSSKPRRPAPPPKPIVQGLNLLPAEPVVEDSPEPAAAQGPSEFSSGGSGGGGGGGGEFFGVRVKGKIALVCDISGSMSSDFPILVRQLREKFPKDTPLILVEGCFFARAGTAPPPQKLNGPLPYMGQEFANDPHVYTCANTTDAIIFAVEELKRNTVMFNNDLQDSGLQSAIDDLEQLRKKRKFALSGRSLNCDAPERLLGFIKSSGGDFKVDPLTRQKSPARPWSP